MPGKIGNSGGKKGRSGRKGYAEELGLHELLNRAWPVERRLAFFQKLSSMAEEGHVEAGKLLMNYSFGKAPETHTLKGGLAIRIIDESSDDK